MSNRPQRASNGKEYRIDHIAVPFCWAVKIGADDGTLYRLIVEQARKARPGSAPADPEKRRLYRKMRRCGVPQDDALDEIDQREAERDRAPQLPALPWEATSAA